MEPFRYHVFVCEQQKPEGVPCCAVRGARSVVEALERRIAAEGLIDVVQVTRCGSLGLCEHGPNMVVYPEGVWYSGVTEADAEEIVRSHFRDGGVVERLARFDVPGLRAEILANREKREAAMRAAERAGALPEDLNQIIRSFQESRAVLTAIELDVFTAVGEGSAASDVAQRLSTDLRATEMLLNALASLGLLAKRDGRFRNAPAAARFFAAGSPQYARPGLLHTVHLWDRWSELTQCVRRGRPAAPDVGSRGAEWTAAFIAAMHRIAAERAPLVVRAVGPLSGRMLDVGGGSGAYAIAFARANADLQIEILDLPEVTGIASGHIGEAGLTDRIATRAGDLRRDPLGRDFRMVFMSAICHMLSPEENLDLFRRCHAALAPGGRIVVQDFILEPDKTTPRFAALFALNMLVGTEGGSSYSETEYAEWLQAAGFRNVARVRLPGPTGLMCGDENQG